VLSPKTLPKLKVLPEAARGQSPVRAEEYKAKIHLKPVREPDPFENSYFPSELFEFYQ
jgi:hypothetical protein